MAPFFPGEDRVLPHELMKLTDPLLAAGTIPSLYVSALAVSPNGARPIGLVDVYSPDHAALARYASAAKSAAGFMAWLDAALGVVEPA